MAYFSEFGYVGLFVASFLAATVLPLSSEVVLTVLLVNGWSPVSLVMVATTGNVLGSVVNYWLGWLLGSGVIGKWMRVSRAEVERAEQRFRQYGLLCLCFAWVPIIGDPITVVAGMLKVRLRWFLVLVAAGKLLRYVVISHLALQAL
jgi:membrane protein YqaA with SNARE-associated domain